MPAAGPLFVFLTKKVGGVGEKESSFDPQPAANLFGCWPDDMGNDSSADHGGGFSLEFFRLEIIIKTLNRLPGLHAADSSLLFPSLFRPRPMPGLFFAVVPKPQPVGCGFERGWRGHKISGTSSRKKEQSRPPLQ